MQTVLSRERVRQWLAAFLCVAVLSPVDAGTITWSKTAAGTYDFTNTVNWTGGVVPGTADTADFSAPNDDQTIVGGDSLETAPRMMDLIFLNRASVSATTRTRTISGCLQVGGTNWFKTGITRLEGTVAGGDGGQTRVGTSADANHDATLIVNGKLLVPNAGALWVGSHAGSSPSHGRVFLEDGGEIDFSSSANDDKSGLSLGRAGAKSAGALIQRGGRATFGRVLLGYGVNAQGCYELFGGTLDVPCLDSDTRFRLGHDGTGLFYQHGGLVTFAADGIGKQNENVCPEIGSGRDQARRGVWFADGGTFDCNANLFLHGYAAGSPQGNSELTLKNTARVIAKNILFRGKSGSGRGQPATVNLLDGAELVAGAVRSREAASADKWDALNVRNARIETSGTTDGDYDFFCWTDAITLYGGVFEFCTRKNVTMRSGDWSANLRTAKGYGVDSLTVTAGGSKFWVPPTVTISGGSGSNATAVAFIDYDAGTVTGLVMTCRGEGYAAGDVLTVTIANPANTRGSGATATATLSANPEPGTFLKTGPSRLLFYNQTAFDGTIEVREGLVIQSTVLTNGLQSVRKIVVGGPDTPIFQTSTGGQSGWTYNVPEAQTVMNPAAELQIGSEHGPGTINGGGGAAGTVFTQRFAKLSVQGPGGSLCPSPAACGADATHGLRYVFDDYVCAPGATLKVGAGTGFSVVISNAVPGAILPGLHVGSSKLPVTVDEDHVVRGLTAEELDAAAAADAHLHVSSSQTLSGDLSTLMISYSSAVTVTIDDALKLAGGQLTVGGVTTGSGTVRVEGGELTSGTGVLDIYDHHVVTRRNNGGSEVFGTEVASRLADGEGEATAVSVTGRPWPEGSQTLANGPCVKFSNTGNSYSGGTYIHDTALAVPSDAVLGAVPETVTNNIFTSGMAMIRAPFDSSDRATLELAATRGIFVQSGYLGLFGGKDNLSDRVLMRVNGPISGHGVLGLGHWSGSSTESIVELAGDNSGFSGTIAIMGRLRVSGERSLPPCGILFAERNPLYVSGGLLCM